MRRHVLCTRFIATAVAAVMMWPAFAVTVEAATATWLAPQPGERITSRNVEVSVGYNTQSDLDVTRLELWIDGRYYATRSLARPEPRGVCSFWWDTAKFAPGGHQLAVRIYAGDKLIATVSSNVVIGQKNYDLRVPNVRFANVKSGDVLRGTVTIKMVVTDDSAEPPIVSLLVDGALKYLTNRQPYVCSLDTTKYPDGQHELQTYAYDSAGNKSDPVVVKVIFENNIERPAAVMVAPEPKQYIVAPSEDDGVGQLLPPPVESRSKADGVARATEAEPLTPFASAPSSEPGVRESKPTSVAQKHLRAATPATRVSDQTGNENAKIIALQPNQRLENRYAMTEPMISQHVASHDATVMARMRSAQIDSICKHQLALVEPLQNTVPPSQSITKRAATGLSPALSSPKTCSVYSPTGTRNAQSGSLVALRPALPAGPKNKSAVNVSSVDTNPASAEPGKVFVSVERKPRSDSGHSQLNWHVRESAPMENAVASVPTANHSAIATERNIREEAELGAKVPAPTVPRLAAQQGEPSEPRPVRVALLPTLRDSSGATPSVPRIAHSGVQPGDRNAKLEKRLIPSKGVVKLRDLVDSLGGVVFWVPETRTAIAYVGNMKIEVRIGKQSVKVNGRLMQTRTAAKIVNGRTIVEASLYYQACVFAEQFAAAARQ
ncbi:MAG: Ig-like domain-containing protein [Armatimonadota bacterium]|nr:Ig-like domain-containing protein [Armatimonadota bacterium]